MPRTGRPRGFDKDVAVQQAMRLFWAQGYETTSLAQLKAAMGDLSTASFYAAFGSKEALFREVVARYLETHGRVTAAERDRNRDGLRDCVRRAIARGELPPDTDPVGLAALFDTFLVGLSTQARDGVPHAALEAAITRLLQLWDGLAAAASPRRAQTAGNAPDPDGLS